MSSTKGAVDMISYEKLWKVMKQCGVSQYTLIKT